MGTQTGNVKEFVVLQIVYNVGQAGSCHWKMCTDLVSFHHTLCNTRHLFLCEHPLALTSISLVQQVAGSVIGEEVFVP